MNSPLNKPSQSLAEFWAARDTRERALFAVAAATAAFGAIYALLLDPALAGRSQLSKSLPVLRQQAAQMQALSKEAAALSGKAAPQTAAITREGIEAALARHGLKPKSVALDGDIARVQLAAASFSGTLNWLDDMQKTARLAVVDANIVALAQPGMIDAALTLRQRGNE